MFAATDGRRVERESVAGPSVLTQRELEVLQGLCAGRGYGELAHAMGISLGTVKKHGQQVFRKLGAATKRELIGLPIQWFANAH
jgi:two-component system nitrate/nitrite response regulator NarL